MAKPYRREQGSGGEGGSLGEEEEAVAWSGKSDWEIAGHPEKWSRQLQSGPPVPTLPMAGGVTRTSAPPVCPALGSSSPGMEPAGEPEALMLTRTEVSRGPEPRTTRHTYSPESAGDTWCSRSSEPWV